MDCDAVEDWVLDWDWLRVCVRLGVLDRLALRVSVPVFICEAVCDWLGDADGLALPVEEPLWDGEDDADADADWLGVTSCEREPVAEGVRVCVLV